MRESEKETWAHEPLLPVPSVLYVAGPKLRRSETRGRAPSTPLSSEEIGLIKELHLVRQVANSFDLPVDVSRKLFDSASVVLKDMRVKVRASSCARALATFYIVSRMHGIPLTVEELAAVAPQLGSKCSWSAAWQVAKEYVMSSGLRLDGHRSATAAYAARLADEANCNPACRAALMRIASAYGGGGIKTFSFLLLLAAYTHDAALPAVGNLLRGARKKAEDSLSMYRLVVEPGSGQPPAVASHSGTVTAIVPVNLKCARCGAEWTTYAKVYTGVSSVETVGDTVRAAVCPVCGATDFHVVGVVPLARGPAAQT